MTDADDNQGDGSLQGREMTFASPAEVDAALALAVDYRGDVTVHTTDGRTLEGYIFDRRPGGADPYCRMMPSQQPGQVRIAYRDIARLSFTGRDTAAGKSWETWVKKYQEKKALGEKAELKPESLDDERTDTAHDGRGG